MGQKLKRAGSHSLEESLQGWATPGEQKEKSAPLSDERKPPQKDERNPEHKAPRPRAKEK